MRLAASPGGSADRHCTTHRRRGCDLQGRPGAKLVHDHPVIISKDGRQRSSEGCLSIPEFRRGRDPRQTVTGARAGLTGNFSSTLEKTCWRGLAA